MVQRLSRASNKSKIHWISYQVTFYYLLAKAPLSSNAAAGRAEGWDRTECRPLKKCREGTNGKTEWSVYACRGAGTEARGEKTSILCSGLVWGGR